MSGYEGGQAMDPMMVYVVIIVVGTPAAVFMYENNLILATSVMSSYVLFSIIMAFVTNVDRKRRARARARRERSRVRQRRERSKVEFLS